MTYPNVIIFYDYLHLRIVHNLKLLLDCFKNKGTRKTNRKDDKKTININLQNDSVVNKNSFTEVIYKTRKKNI